MILLFDKYEKAFGKYMNINQPTPFTFVFVLLFSTPHSTKSYFSSVLLYFEETVVNYTYTIEKAKQSVLGGYFGGAFLVFIDNTLLV